MPAGLPGLSYNTLSTGLFAVGVFVAARWLLVEAQPRSKNVLRSPLFWAGVAHAGAAFAYASIVLAVVTTAVVILLLARGERIRATLTYAAGGAAFCLVVSADLPLRGKRAPEGGRRVLRRQRRDRGLHLLLVLDQARAVHRAVPAAPFAAFMAAIAIVASRRYPLVTAAAACLLPFLGRGSLLTGPSASQGWISCYALLGRSSRSASRTGASRASSSWASRSPPPWRA